MMFWTHVDYRPSDSALLSKCHQTLKLQFDCTAAAHQIAGPNPTQPCDSPLLRTSTCEKRLPNEALRENRYVSYSPPSGPSGSYVCAPTSNLSAPAARLLVLITEHRMTRFIGEAVGQRSGRGKGTSAKDLRKEMEGERGVH